MAIFNSYVKLPEGSPLSTYVVYSISFTAPVLTEKPTRDNRVLGSTVPRAVGINPKKLGEVWYMIYFIWYYIYMILYFWFYIYICYYTYDILYMIYYIYMILYILYLSDRVSKQFDLVVIADTEVKLVWSFCQRMGYEWIGYINIKWLMKLGSQPCWTWVCRIFSSLLWQWEVECCSTRWIIFFDRVSIPTMVGDIGDICQIWMTFPMQKFGEG